MVYFFAWSIKSTSADLANCCYFRERKKIILKYFSFRLYHSSHSFYEIKLFFSWWKMKHVKDDMSANSMFSSWLVIYNFITFHLWWNTLSPVKWSGKSLSICNMPPLLSLVRCGVPVKTRHCKRRSTFGDDIPGSTFCRKLLKIVHGVTFAIRYRPSWRCPFSVRNSPSLSSLLRLFIRFVRACTVHSCYQVQECVIYILA